MPLRRSLVCTMVVPQRQSTRTHRDNQPVHLGAPSRTGRPTPRRSKPRAIWRGQRHRRRRLRRCPWRKRLPRRFQAMGGRRRRWPKRRRHPAARPAPAPVAAWSLSGGSTAASTSRGRTLSSVLRCTPEVRLDAAKAHVIDFASGPAGVTND